MSEEARALWSLGPLDRAAALRTLTVPQLAVLQEEIAEIVSERLRRLEVGLAMLDQQEFERQREVDERSRSRSPRRFFKVFGVEGH